MEGIEKGRLPSAQDVTRLQQEQRQVVSSCQEKIQHWNKVESDYDALQERLGTLPDKLSYDIMVPFGPLAFMPGRLVQTNEITVLLGDNWFAKCSAKQAATLVDHRKKHVRKAREDMQEVMKNFESRVEFTKDLQRMSKDSGEFFDIREEANEGMVSTKGKHRTAHRPHSKPKATQSSEVDFREGGTDGSKEGFVDHAELWARLEELEKQEELQGELAEVTESCSRGLCSEDNKENLKTGMNVVESEHRTQGNPIQSDTTPNTTNVNGSGSHASDDEDAKDHVATIHFSHTVEPKRVRINTGKNTTLKYSERKEEAKRKRKNSNGNGHSAPELPVIKTPADIYRVFVDVVNGEYVPRKSIMKSRSRENSVCSDTSENSSHELEERKAFLRNISLEDAFSDHNEEDIRIQKKLSPVYGPLEAFSGTVIEKEAFSISVPMMSLAHPALPTIQEWKSEELTPDVPAEGTKRISKFKAARIQQQK